MNISELILQLSDSIVSLKAAMNTEDVEGMETTVDSMSSAIQFFLDSQE